MITAWTHDGKDTLELESPLNRERIVDIKSYDEKNMAGQIDELFYGDHEPQGNLND